MTLPTPPANPASEVGRKLSLMKLRRLAAQAHTIHVKISAIWCEVESDEHLKEVAGYAMCGVAETSAALKAAIRAHLLSPAKEETNDA